MNDFYFHFIHLDIDYHIYHNFKYMEIQNIQTLLQQESTLNFLLLSPWFVHLSGVQNMKQILKYQITYCSIIPVCVGRSGSGGDET